MAAPAPLEGIRVVELASYVAAPGGGALLADLGADVVKVEVPGGEIYRHSSPRFAGIKSEFAEAPHFHMDNRGKRSLVLDITRPEALAALKRVIASADVLLTNMIAERLEKYGLDDASLRASQPGLIFAHLSGYGSEGPDARTPAFDYTAFWARTGFMDQLHEPDAPPAYLRPGVGDHSASLALVTGILAALRTRDRTGHGQRIDVNLMHIGFYIQGNDAAMTLATGQEVPRHDRRRPRNPLWCQYRTADDRWLFLVMIESDRYWPSLCRAVDRPEWIDDGRFRDARMRYRNSEMLTAALGEIFAGQPLAKWEEVLKRERLIWSPVRSLLEATGDPQAEAMGMFSEMEHAEAGRFRTVAPPVRMSLHPMRGERCAPALGADSEAVLRENGLSDEEIAAVLGRRAPAR